MTDLQHKKCYRVTVNALRVRSRPCIDDNCTIVDVLRSGDEVEVTNTLRNDGYLWGLIGTGRWIAMRKFMPPRSYVREIQCKDSKWYKLNAIDTSGYEHFADEHKAIASAKYSIFVHRLSHGTITDKSAHRIAIARMYGRAVGGYVVITPYRAHNGKQQVIAAANVFGPMAGDLFVLDMEYVEKRDTMRERMNQAAETALEICARTGAIPVLYTSAYYFSSLYGANVPAWLTNFSLWIADYNPRYYGNPRMGAMPRELLAMHQFAYNVDGRIYGFHGNGRVDLSLVSMDFVKRIQETRAQRWR